MTARESLYIVGEFQLQNDPDCARFSPPTQLESLGILGTGQAMLFQFDQEIGLPVVAPHSPENYLRMCKMYAEPDKSAGGNILTCPMKFTADAYGGGHPAVDFSRDDRLVFFTSESVITSDFPRLYIGRFSDFEQRARNRNATRVIWGKKYQRPSFAPGNERHVREVFVIQPGKSPVRKTRPASEGLVSTETLLGETGRGGMGGSPPVAGDDD